MESGGGTWPERLRPLQLPRHPPHRDRLTHLPLSLAVNNIHERTSSPADMSLLASTQTHTQTMRGTFPEGLFIREGADGCCLMRHLTALRTGVVLGPCCGVVVRILHLRFAQGCYRWRRSYYPMRDVLQGQSDTRLLLEFPAITV